MTCPTGGKDVEHARKGRLLEIFGDWTDMVTDLIRSVNVCGGTNISELCGAACSAFCSICST